MLKVEINLPPQWVLSKNGQGKLPIAVIQDYVEQKYQASVEDQSFTTLVFNIKSSITPDMLTAEISDLLGKTYQSDAVEIREKVLALEVTGEVSDSIPDPDPHESAKEQNDAANDQKTAAEADAEAAAEAASKSVASKHASAKAAVPTAKAPEGGPDDQDAESILNKIRTLTGCKPFLELCEELHAMAPLLREKHLTHIAAEQNYIFSIDNGYGSSTMAELFQDFLYSEQILEKGRYSSDKKPLELTLSLGGSSRRSSDDDLNSIAEKLHTARGVIVLDVFEWTDKLASAEFRDFLNALHKNDQNCVYIFKIPYLEEKAIAAAQGAIADVMRVRSLSFAPLSMEQLQGIAAEELQKFSYTADDSAWRLFRTRLAQEKSDGRFYGINTVEKIVNEMLYLKLASTLRGTSNSDTVISQNDLLELASAEEHAEVPTAEALFGSLIGIGKIRDKIYEIVDQIEFARKTPGVSTPTMHMRFIGNPGTGKTTVARIVGLLLKERNLLSKGEFFEHSGSDFIGRYVGSTAPLTMSLCRDAYGSVMFIDEAYTLAHQDYLGGQGFGREAVDALIAQMENHRNDFVVIMAGYPAEMQQLMGLNPGLEGRMPYLLEFPNYDRDELEQIFYLYVKQSAFTLEEGLTDRIHAYFTSLKEEFITSKDFSNARYVRSLFENTWGKAVTRCRIEGSDSSILTASDFDAATRETTENSTPRKSKRSGIGFHIA